MSTISWNLLKLSPSLIGASLFFSSSSYAQERVPAQAAATSTSQVVATVAPAVDPLAQLAQTQVVASTAETQKSVPAQTVAATTNPMAGSPEAAVEPLAQLPQTTAKETSVSPLTPSEVRPSVNQAPTTVAQQVPATDNTTAESTGVLDQLNRYNEEVTGNSDSIDQVTNVTQLRDVSPGDWAYEALRSLVERYGCIAGYPDGTYRGNRAMSRYEFAAGLNACLQQIERIIRTTSEGAASKQDLATIQQLIAQFGPELAVLRGNVDALQARTGELELTQFSTTTKLSGEVIFGV